MPFIFFLNNIGSVAYLIDSTDRLDEKAVCLGTQGWLEVEHNYENLFSTLHNLLKQACVSRLPEMEGNKPVARKKIQTLSYRVFSYRYH
ncbi:hypothetical protein B738_25145 [Photorhabdus temperata subsp. temperata M1021]|nr:hypothetical protein B738_25145 [Photorhabdus temperata subsp. temperata M1021]